MKPPVLLLGAGLALAACGGATSGVGSSSSSGTPSHSPSPSPEPTPPPAACADRAVDLEVSGTDLNAYPPYAVAGCSLVYVSRARELVLRDLATGEETKLAGGDESPRRPSISDALVAWEDAAPSGSTSVKVLVRATGEKKTLDVRDASEPRVRGASVSFSVGSLVGDMDVWLWEVGSAEPRLAIGGPGQQRFSDVSDAFVVATDFAEDPNGIYDGASDLADIVVLDRTTGAVTVRKAPGKQAFPMLVPDRANGAGAIVAYLEWVLVHPEPKLEGYALRAGRVVASSPADDWTLANVTYRAAEVARPAAANGMLEWIANPDGRTTLWRAPADGSRAPAAVSGLDGLVLYAPAPDRERGGLTVLATRAQGSEPAPRLRAIAH